MNVHKTILALLLCISLPASGQKAKYALVSNGWYWQLIDTSGKVVTDKLYSGDEHFAGRLPEGISRLSEGMVGWKEGGKCGFKTITGKVVAPCVYGDVNCFRKGFAVVKVYKWHTVPPEYDNGVPVAKYGLIDRRGRLVADTVYDYISDMNDSGVAILCRDNQLSLLGSNGKPVVPYTFFTDKLLWPEPEFAEGLLPVLARRPAEINVADGWMADNMVGFINTKGQLVLDTIYSALGASANRIYEREEAGRNFPRCSRLPQFNWYEAHSPYYLKKAFYTFMGDRCVVVRQGLNVVINSAGDSICNIGGGVKSIENIDGYIKVEHEVYRRWRNFEDAEIHYDTVDKQVWGRDGQIITFPARYEPVAYWNRRFIIRNPYIPHWYDHPFALAGLDGRKIGDASYAFIAARPGPYAFTDTGMIDTNGRIIMPFDRKKFSWFEPQAGGVVIASLASNHNLYGTIDTNSKWLVQPKYSMLVGSQNGYFMFKPEKDFYPYSGYLDSNGKEVIPAKFNVVTTFVTMDAIVKKQKKNTGNTTNQKSTQNRK